MLMIKLNTKNLPHRLREDILVTCKESGSTFRLGVIKSTFNNTMLALIDDNQGFKFNRIPSTFTEGYEGELSNG